MIQVSKSYSNSPNILKSDNCKKKIEKAMLEKDSHNFGYYYNEQGDVKKDLELIYHQKCAYCESKVNHIATLQVEHYRPKKKVTEDINHNGYYWLGYEWSNLLLACPKCNQQGAKGNYFPISGERVYNHTDFLTNNKLDSNKCYPNKSPLIDERPLLLNPELDNPKQHFIFNEYGKIEGNTIRGKKTIEICKLDREHLNKNRKKEVIDYIFKQIKNLILGFETRESMPKETFINMLKNIFIELEDKQNISHSYALLGWYMFNNFDKFIKIHIHSKFQILIIEAWNRYKKDEL